MGIIIIDPPTKPQAAANLTDDQWLDTWNYCCLHVQANTPAPLPLRVFGFTLVDDAHNWKRWWSMRWLIVGAFCAGAAAAYQWLPADWMPEIPALAKKLLGLGALVSMGMAGVSRVLKQPEKC